MIITTLVSGNKWDNVQSAGQYYIKITCRREFLVKFLRKGVLLVKQSCGLMGTPAPHEWRGQEMLHREKEKIKM